MALHFPGRVSELVDDQAQGGLHQVDQPAVRQHLLEKRQCIHAIVLEVRVRELLKHARHEVADDLSYAVLVVCLQELIISARVPFVDYHWVSGEHAQFLVFIFFLYHVAIRE